MIVYVDIDETICFFPGKREYHLAEPDNDNIAKINKLYDEGHEITYWTARSTVSIDKREEYTELTRNQLDSWGCKYHNLRVGDKPHYDLLVCDKSKRIEEL